MVRKHSRGTIYSPFTVWEMDYKLFFGSWWDQPVQQTEIASAAGRTVSYLKHENQKRCSLRAMDFSMGICMEATS